MANKKQKLLLPLVKNKNKFTCFDIKKNQISIVPSDSFITLYCEL